MLAKICLKRFRFPLYALFFTTLCYELAEKWDSGALYSLMLLVLLPLFVIALIWAVYTTIRDVLRYPQHGLPDDPPTYAERIVWRFQDERDAIKALNQHGKIRYFLFRILGVMLVLGGLIAIIKEAIVWGTLLLIAGVAFWQSALSKSIPPNQEK